MHTDAIVTALGLRDRHMFPLPHFHTNASSTTKHACGVLSEACRLSAQLEHCKGLGIATDYSGLLRIAFSYMLRVVIFMILLQSRIGHTYSVTARRDAIILGEWVLVFM